MEGKFDDFRTIETKYDRPSEAFNADYFNHDDITWDHVYQPNEDSFLLIDALYQDLECLKSTHPLTCIEVGSGSGVVISSLAMLMDKAGYKQCVYYATDVNM